MTISSTRLFARLMLLAIVVGVVVAEAAGQDAAPDEAPQKRLIAPDPVVADPTAAAAQQPAATEELVGGPITGPRDLLRGYGIDDSFFDRLLDGRPMAEDETETLLKVMFRLRDFAKADLARWARPELNLPELLEDPEAPRGEVFHLSGRVTQVEVLRPLAEVVERYEFDRYYRCEFLLAFSGEPAVVFTRNVPQAWREGGAVDQRASAYGLLLKFAGSGGEPPQPVFVAQRVAWHPDTMLGNLGMDVGLLDDVRNRTGLTGHDREAFYQMLAAVARTRPGQLLADAHAQLEQAGKELKWKDEDGKEHYSVVPLFNQPDTQRGRLVSLRGTARRVLRVEVGDPDIVERFGIDHYYNVFLYTDDSQRNPLVFCVRKLPPGMPTGDGPQFGEFVEVAGFFLKTWAYRVPSMVPDSESAGGGKRMQLAPLLIGRQSVWFPAPVLGDDKLIGAIAGCLFVVALVCIWFAMWSYGRGDKRFHARTLAKTYAMDSGISLNEIGLDGEGQPDFSGLAEMERRAAEERGE